MTCTLETKTPSIHNTSAKRGKKTTETMEKFTCGMSPFSVLFGHL